MHPEGSKDQRQPHPAVRWTCSEDDGHSWIERRTAMDAWLQCRLCDEQAELVNP